MSENEIRLWIRKIVEVFRTGSELTATKIDDQTCEMVLKALDNDLIWEWLWKLIGRYMADEEAILVRDEPVRVGAAEVGINPLTVWAVVKLIIETWKLLKK